MTTLRAGDHAPVARRLPAPVAAAVLAAALFPAIAPAQGKSEGSRTTPLVTRPVLEEEKQPPGDGKKPRVPPALTLQEFVRKYPDLARKIRRACDHDGNGNLDDGEQREAVAVLKKSHQAYLTARTERLRRDRSRGPGAARKSGEGGQEAVRSTSKVRFQPAKRAPGSTDPRSEIERLQQRHEKISHKQMHKDPRDLNGDGRVSPNEKLEWLQHGRHTDVQNQVKPAPRPEQKVTAEEEAERIRKARERLERMRAQQLRESAGGR